MTGVASPVVPASHFGFRLFTHGERSGDVRLARRAALQRRLSGGERKDIHSKGVLQKVFCELQLRGIFVGSRQGSVRRRETMRVHEPVDIAGIF